MTAPPWLVELPEVGSTSTWALANRDALATGSVVFTRRQTAGRGRDGRSWASPPGVLTASIVLAAAPSAGPAIALAAGLACIHAVAGLMPALDPQLALKWPNDVLLGGGKLAGVLCEGAGNRLIVGIGLNRAASPDAVPGAASLHRHGEPPEELPLLARIRDSLLEGAGMCLRFGLAPLLPQLRARDALLGAALSVVTRTERLHGTGGGLDESGCLLVVVPGGGIARIAAGHVEAWSAAPR